jgi:hypothetical protein
MPVPRNPVALLLLGALAAGSPLAAGRWIDVHDWKDRTGDHDSVLLDRFKEEPVPGRFATTGEAFEAEALALPLPVAGDAAERAVKDLLGNRLDPLGELHAMDATLSAAWQSSPVLSEAVRDMDAKAWATELRSFGLDPDRPFAGTRLQTRSYNLFPSRQGSSTATFLIADGGGLFGRRCSLLVVYRTDRAKQWGWHSLHEPLSFGYTQRVMDLVTSGELAWIATLAQRLGATSPARRLPYASTWYDSVELWRDLRRSCLGE